MVTLALRRLKRRLLDNTGYPDGASAVSVLGSRELVLTVRIHPRAGCAVPSKTINLNIECLVRFMRIRLYIRHLVVTWRNSVVFLPGQALIALFRDGFIPEGGTAVRTIVVRSAIPIVQAFQDPVDLQDLVGLANEDEIDWRLSFFRDLLTQWLCAPGDRAKSRTFSWDAAVFKTIAARGTP